MTQQENSAQKRKIVVTGASGFVGSELVPILAREGVDLLLVGRNPAALSALYPAARCCGYDAIATEAKGYDTLLHLATMNNDAAGDLAAFNAANVDLLLETAARAKEAGIAHLINVSSIHALDPANTSPYAESKRLAADRLAEESGIAVTTVYLPLVYGSRWSGSLARLNRLPPWLARALFAALAALKPTLHVSRLASFVMAGPAADDRALVLSDGQAGNAVFKFVKRAFDLGCALAIVLLLWWALALLWLMVRLSSPGPGIFAQRRVGKDGRPFVCYKFRTMTAGAPSLATHDAPAALITPVGRFLRNTKLDELPQVANIIRNDMSLVGPRPCLPIQTELIEARRRTGALALKPGISGLAQINNIDMRDPELLARWDARYRDLQGLVLDLKIILATATGRGRGDPMRAPAIVKRGL